MMEEKKIFFNGLNELRAFAALFVIFHHIELFKNREHISSLFDSKYFSHFIATVGKNGVYLFFVLSGFLITYLLLKEKENLSTVLLKKFYLRRVFRIWPLYYLIMFIGFILIPFLATKFDLFSNTPYYFGLISNPENYSMKSVLFYLFFLPNLATNYFGLIVVGASQAWSVGVEEQFYILWPLFVCFLSKRKLLWLFLFLVFFLIVVHVFFHPFIFSKIISFLNFDTSMLSSVFEVIVAFPFESMSIGAIGAFMLFYHKDSIIYFTKFKFLYLIVIFTTSVFMFFPIVSIYFQNIILSVLFLLLILITINDDNIYTFRNKYLAHIGKISYGVYMFHPFIMFLVFPFANRYFPFNESPFLYNFFVYFFIFFITIVVSHFSYKYFESIFINIKETKYKSL